MNTEQELRAALQDAYEALSNVEMLSRKCCESNVEETLGEIERKARAAQERMQYLAWPSA